jgi:hydroxymethylpyrimidine/phosphomethylpyrimidine kinase
MDYLLENITANVPEIEQLIKNKSIQKKKDFESDSQLSLF